MTSHSRFLIVGMQRSGTTVTHHCLGGHPQVSLTKDEVSAHPFFTKGLSVFTTGKESFEARCRGYTSLFDAIALAATSHPVRAAGLKVALSSAEDAIDLVECLQQYFEGIKVVMVRRADLVAQCGSLYRAMRTGQWHNFGGRAGKRDEVFDIPVDEFAAYVAKCRSIDAQLDRLKATHEVRTLHYEADIEGGIDAAQLFDFVGVDRVPATWMEMQKVSPPVEKFVSNHAELVARLKMLPPVTVESAEAAAFERMRARATTEQPYLLAYRSEDRLRKARLKEAEVDVQLLIKKVEELDPWMAGRAAAVANALIDKGVAVDGVDRLSALHSKDPSFFLHRAEVGLAYRPQQALNDLRRVVLDGTIGSREVVWVSWLLEKALLNEANIGSARGFAEELLQKYPDVAPLLFLVAMIAHKAGMNAVAKPLLERALTADPGHQRARSMLDAIRGV